MTGDNVLNEVLNETAAPVWGGLNLLGTNDRARARRSLLSQR